MITYQEESFYNVDDTWKVLFEKHYQEIAWKKDKIKLNVDYKKYESIFKLGQLKIYTAREDGLIIAYAWWFVITHLHYMDCMKAMNDVLYVDPDKRGGRTGIKLIQFSELELKKLGVHTIGMHIKKSFDWGIVAERLGYEPVETLYEKFVGE